MSSIALVTDSTASLPDAYARQHNVRVVPLYINIEGTNYRDGVDIQPEAFYELLPHASTLPTTSQPSVGDFVEVYRALADEGVTEIISVHLSAGISGTVNSATLAAQQVPQVRVAVVDTRSAVVAQMLAVEAGVAARDAGADFDQTLAAIHQVIETQRTVFTVDSLEYLYKGGRIGGAAALLGSLLQIKPMLYFNEGKIDVLERIRRSSRALTRMVELMGNWLGTDVPLRAVVMETDNPEAVATLEQLLRQQLNIASFDTVSLTPVIGAHVGNGTLGLCCCPMALLQPRIDA
ncbi:MAG: DegV family protein [Chloroflexi bacterium]|jgi:DegV family protein with EDD domain|nr:DegV family protein [Chloroflexota bacterium]